MQFTDKDSERREEIEGDEDKYKKISASVTLNEFQLKLFKNEPKLVSKWTSQYINGWTIGWWVNGLMDGLLDDEWMD